VGLTFISRKAAESPLEARMPLRVVGGLLLLAVLLGGCSARQRGSGEALPDDAAVTLRYENPQWIGLVNLRGDTLLRVEARQVSGRLHHLAGDSAVLRVTTLVQGQRTTGAPPNSFLYLRGGEVEGLELIHRSPGLAETAILVAPFAFLLLLRMARSGT
jgi:hypothetical protein